VSTIAAPAFGSVVVVTMTDTLNQAWQAIRKNHDQVPDVTIGEVPGRSPASGPVSWSSGVLLAGSDTIGRGPQEIMAWLLHQGAHGLLYTRGEHSEGNEGRYHNKAFLAAAEELGLDAEGDAVPGLGYVNTIMRPGTVRAYRHQIGQLATALQSWEPPAPRPGSSRAAGRNRIMVHCQCDPPRKLAITPSVLGKGPVRCEVCGQLFEP
jgi:hypothetical protein